MCDKYMVSGCVHNNVCAQVCTFMYMYTLWKQCENVNPKSQQVVQAQSVCVCVWGGGVQAIYITMQGVLLHMYVLCE